MGTVERKMEKATFVKILIALVLVVCSAVDLAAKLHNEIILILSYNR